MSAPRGRTEIFDFEAGDASEARVYYSGNSRWGVDTVHFYILDARCNPTCPVPSYRSSFVASQRASAPCGISIGGRSMQQVSFEIPQGNNASQPRTFTLRDDGLTGDVKSHSDLITKSHKNVIDKVGKAGRKKRFK